jgi:CheY-like chemotaxis protein
MQPQSGVLIADDSDNDTMLFEHAWQDAQYDIPFVRVVDGADALHYLEEAFVSSSPERPFPRVALIDLKMPRVSGFDLLTVLQQKKEFASIIPLVWSDSNEIADVRRAYELGARCYLPKPGTNVGWKMLVERVHDFHQSHGNLGPPAANLAGNYLHFRAERGRGQ